MRIARTPETQERISDALAQVDDPTLRFNF
jgi:hypothetical protein